MSYDLFCYIDRLIIFEKHLNPEEPHSMTESPLSKKDDSGYPHEEIS